MTLKLVLLQKLENSEFEFKVSEWLLVYLFTQQ